MQLSMLLGELLTVRQHALPIEIVLFDNSSLDMVRLEQEVAGLPYFGTDRRNPDFAALAATRQAKGFALSMTRMSLHGQAEELVETVMANWRDL